MHMRVLHPSPGIWAFYDGRVPGYRHSDEPNWVDPWALSLGICAYALVDGPEALVFDAHVSVAHAERMRAELAAAGVERFTVVLSHWHLDHIAGLAAFADCEIVANERTYEQLVRNRAGIESGALEGPPAINPLALPTRVFADSLTLEIGRRSAQLLRANIHSDDATLLWLPADGILLAGDIVEDTVTFVDFPEEIDVHLAELARVAELGPRTVLASHGSPDIIARGGHSAGLLTATRQYLEVLRRFRDDGVPCEDLRTAIAPALEAGWVEYFAPYEEVHAANVELIAKHRSRAGAGR